MISLCLIQTVTNRIQSEAKLATQESVLFLISKLYLQQFIYKNQTLCLEKLFYSP